MTFYDVKDRGRSKMNVGAGIMNYVPESGLGTKVEVLVPNAKANEYYKYRFRLKL